jgi:uncharacterized protein YbjT (DUF2867 family)
MNLYVVAGATGHVGSVVADELLRSGKKVRVIVRSAEKGAGWNERGAELAVGSLSDPEFLAKALTGASGFFALLPPDSRTSEDEDFYVAQRRNADTIALAVRRSGVPLVVLLSSIGADLPSGTGPIQNLHYLENRLRAGDTKLVAIRAAYFQENLAGVVPAARQAGVYPNFLPSPDTAVPMVATRDIGRLAANILQSPPEAGETIDLLGPGYTPRQLAEKLGSALGKTLHILDIPAAGHVQALMEAGLPRSIAEVYAELYAALGSGVLQPHGDRTEHGPTPIDEILPTLVGA